MQNEERNRFIQKLKVISNVLKRELADQQILSPSEEPLLSNIITKFDELYAKMSK